MKNEFYQEEKIHHIYIVYNPYSGSAYIGKTCSKNPRSRLRAHIRGECKLTTDDFTADPDDVQFQLLESLICTGSDAYRHIVAWCYFFEEKGIILLNAAGTVQDTENLHPQTKLIYDSACAPFSLEHVLTRKVLPLQPTPKAPDSDIPPLCHLGIRVPEDILVSFRTFCTKKNLTQRDALRLLLLSQDDPCCQMLVASVERDFERKDSVIADLKATIEQKQAQIQRMRNRSRVVVEACQQYARKAIAALPTPTYPKLKALSFKASKRVLNFSSYSYPTAAGVGYFQLEYLVYGRGCAAPLFVLGHTKSGTKVKLRWYDRDSYVGSAFKWSSHSYKHSEWLVGYTIAPDGAADLVVAFPLSDTDSVPQTEPASYTAPALHPTIDEIIATAKRTSN